MTTHSLRPARLVAAVTLAAAALGTAAQTAPAATVAAEGGTLVYRAAPGERNGVVLNGYSGNRIRFNEAGNASITAWPAACQPIEPGGLLCPVPSSVRVELADGNDSFALFDDAYPHGLEVLGGDGDDELAGHGVEARAKTFEGGAGHDQLKGYAGDDVLRGGPGNDILWGDDGNDELRGDDGADQLKPDNGKAPGNDVVDGGAGFDVVESEWVEQGSSATPPPVSLSFDGAANDGRPGEADNVFGIERTTMYVSGRFSLSDGPDELTLFSNTDGGPSTVFAGGGNDRVTGEDHEETIDGGAGDDVLEGGRRSDTIVGGPGRDRILGDESDTGCTWAPEYCLVFGNDTIDARDGERDDINCGPGTDRLVADPIDVHAGCETVDGGVADPGTPGGPGQPGDGGGPGTGGRDSVAPRAVVLTRNLRAALRSGLRVRVTGAAAGRLRLTATHRGRTAAAGTTTVAPGREAVVRLRFTKAAKRRLARTRSARLEVAGGGLRTTITLKRRGGR
jgi:Ca2+-binding RTX toxin-like protein